MANRRYRATIPEQEDIDLEEQYGPRRFLESDIRANPMMRSSFRFEELEDRYPVQPIQMRQAREEDRRLREDEIEYKKNVLAERMTEVELKKAARDLDMFESRVNREDAMLEQVPLARQELGALDPRSPDYLQQRMNVINKYPVAFEYQPFVETVDKPLLFRHGRLKEARVESGEEVTEDAFNKASILLSESGLKKRVEAGDPIATMQAKVAYDTVNKFMAQRGFGAPPAESTGMAPEMETAEPEVYEFNSLEEADSSGLPVGTIIYINGRKAIIE
jgi:hypothetical protein